MQQWEYYVLRLTRELDSQIDNRINDLGSLGWELITAVIDGYERKFIFKRPKRS